MSKKNMTFEEETRDEYVKDVFNAPMVVACLVFFLTVLFWGAEDYFAKILSDKPFYFIVKQLVYFIFPALTVFVPFLFYNKAVGQGTGTLFKKEKMKVNPAFYVLGSVAVSGIAIPLYHLSSLVVEKMNAAGFVFTPRSPYFGNPASFSLGKIIVFIIFAALIPSILNEIAVRGFLLENTKKANGAGAVILSALVFSLPHLTIEAIPFTFVCGLILGWLYIKTDSIYVTLSAHVVMNGIIAALWIYKTTDPDGGYVKAAGIISIVCGLLGISALCVLFKLYGFRLNNVDSDKKLTRRESLKAILTSWGLYVFIGITVFLMLFYYVKKPEEDSDDGTSPTQASETVSEVFVTDNIIL